MQELILLNGTSSFMPTINLALYKYFFAAVVVVVAVIRAVRMILVADIYEVYQLDNLIKHDLEFKIMYCLRV